MLAQHASLLAKQGLLPWNKSEMCGRDFNFPPRFLDIIKSDEEKKTFEIRIISSEPTWAYRHFD